MKEIIPNNPNYDMPPDSFFKYHFLTHRDRIFTAQSFMRFGEMTTALLNVPAENIRSIFEQTIEFAKLDMSIKNETTMTEFVQRVLKLEEIATTLPPYCYTNIDLVKEKKRAERMKEQSFLSKLYDTDSAEYEEYSRYKEFFSSYGTGLYVILCTAAEMSDEFFSRVPKRCESEYTLAWGAFNELSALPAELRAVVPFYDRIKASSVMDVRLGVSGMRSPTDANKFIVADTCEFRNAYSAIQYDFFKAIQYSCVPIRCRNCERFFLATDSYKTLYCNAKSPDNPSKTCRQIGAKNNFKERAESNPILQTYNKARKRYYQHFLRGTISETEHKKITHYLETMRDKTIRGHCDEDGELLTYTKLEKLFERKTLFAALQIGDENGQE